MRIEIILFIITAIIVVNIYTEGKYIKNFYAFKKYYKMAGVILGSFFIYFIIKKNPMKTRELLTVGTDYIKYLPLDKDTKDYISPVLDFTSKHNWGNIGGNHHVVEMPEQQNPNILRSGGKTTKRSVSETKKKFIASRQGWKCSGCGEILNHTYEIDHIISLENGGNNEISNLTALCRSCHGLKTASSFL